MRPRILIAEDDALQGEVLRSTLEGRGYDAEIVGDGLEAVRKLCVGRYDLALIDFQLPDVDGLAAARLLHGFLQTDDRPRLIALTAAADRLRDKAASSGGTPFDAVVSKGHGLSALLDAVDVNLFGVAARRAAVAERDARDVRRRRRRASLAAIPFLVMVAAFTVAFGWASISLQHVDTTARSVQRANALGNDAHAFVDAVQDAEASQRGYVATGAASHLQTFMADVQRVGRMLVSQTSLSADGAPGFAADAPIQEVVETRLRTLLGEARTRASGAGGAALSVNAGREATGVLRGWAADLARGSQLAVVAGIEQIRGNIEVALAILAAGALFGLWKAGRAVRRRWTAELPLREPMVWHGTVMPPDGPWSLPRLLRPVASAPIEHPRIG